ncbi:MAG: hypothetical protein HZB25_10950 [Candidatus Eisenbacteria bacterium]|nr:hypothetical protein [Candidatus Eisenbacteria bacterium]
MKQLRKRAPSIPKLPWNPRAVLALALLAVPVLAPSLTGAAPAPAGRPAARSSAASAARKDPGGHLPGIYPSRPIFERPFPAQEVPRGIRSLSARECGRCHADTYREWQQSVHAQAWPDPQFQAELRKQPGVSWLCVNCHTPLVNQLDSVVVSLAGNDVERPIKRANPLFDPGLKPEGVTCAACHVRDGYIEGPSAASTAPHPTRFNPIFRDASLCTRCHEAVQSYPGKNFICTFQTGQEWLQGPYGQSGKPCQDCHMPEVVRSAAPGAPKRRGAHHSWIGSHLRKGFETDLALWEKLAAMRPVGTRLDAGPAPRGAAGSVASWKVQVVNARAGHRLPTGDPECQLSPESSHPCSRHR